MPDLPAADPDPLDLAERLFGPEPTGDVTYRVSTRCDTCGVPILIAWTSNRRCCLCLSKRTRDPALRARRGREATHG